MDSDKSQTSTSSQNSMPLLGHFDDPGLTEDAVLALLKNRDLSTESIEQISNSAAPKKSRKVRLVLALHPRSPRKLTVRLIREFYTSDLMHFTLMPSASPDLKRIAEETLISRLASLTLGERISVARRCSALVVAALLLDKESRVWQAALENPRLTEAAIVKGLQRPAVSPALVEAVSHHAKWSLRNEIRIALLRSPHTPMARALEFSRRIPPPQMRDILHTSRLPEKIKEYLEKQAVRR